MLRDCLHRIVPLGLALCLLAGPAVAERAPDGAAGFFDAGFGDFQAELETARAEGKQGVLLFFEQEECPFCRRMKERVLNRTQVQDYFHRHFLIFPVDIEGDVEITDFEGNPVKEKDFAFRQNRVRATPVFQFYNLAGEPVARYTGPTRDVDEFMLLGRYVVEQGYKEMPFARYKREAAGGVGSGRP